MILVSSMLSVLPYTDFASWCFISRGLIEPFIREILVNTSTVVLHLLGIVHLTDVV